MSYGSASSITHSLHITKGQRGLCAELSVLLGQAERPVPRDETCFRKTGLKMQADGDSQAVMEGSRDV